MQPIWGILEPFQSPAPLWAHWWNPVSSVCVCVHFLLLLLLRRRRRSRRKKQPENPSKAIETRTDAGALFTSLHMHMWKTWRGRRGGAGFDLIFLGVVLSWIYRQQKLSGVVFSRIWRSPESRSLKSGFYHERNRHGPSVEDPRSSQLRLLQRFIVVKVSANWSINISSHITKFPDIHIIFQWASVAMSSDCKAQLFWYI